MGGTLKVTVPTGDDWADATSDSVDVSGSGSVVYGGNPSTDIEANEEDEVEPDSVDELVISNINMRAGE